MLLIRLSTWDTINLPRLLVICLLLLSHSYHIGVYGTSPRSLHTKYKLAILHQGLIFRAELRQLTENQLCLIYVLDIFINQYTNCSFNVNQIPIGWELKVNILVKNMEKQDKLIEFYKMNEQLECIYRDFDLELVCNVFWYLRKC